MIKVLKPRAQSDKQGLQQVGRLETISSITNMADGVIRFFLHATSSHILLMKLHIYIIVCLKPAFIVSLTLREITSQTD